MFKIIYLDKKTKKLKYNQIYKRCFYKNKLELNIKKIVFYGVKYIKTFDYDNASIENILEAIKIINYTNEIIKRLSFLSIINIFPIGKDFNGYKFEAKDFYSTKQYLKDKNLYDLILEYSLEDFLFNYYNLDIINYNVSCFMIFDKYAKLNGQKTIMEKFSEKFNVPIYIRIDDKTFLNKKTLEILNIKDNEDNKENEDNKNNKKR